MADESKSYVEYVADEKLRRGLVGSWEFTSAKYLFAAAGAFLLFGIVLAISGTFSIRGEKAEILKDLRDQNAETLRLLNEQSGKTSLQLREIVEDARKQTAERREALRDQEDNTSKQLNRLLTDIEKGKAEIAAGTETFKNSTKELRQEVINTIVRQLEADLGRSGSDLMTQVTMAKTKVTNAAESMSEVERDVAQLKVRLDQAKPVIQQSENVSQQIASITAMERTARAADDATRRAQSATEASQKFAAAAETSLNKALSDLPRKVSNASVLIADLNHRIEGLRKTIDTDDALLREQRNVDVVGKRVDALEDELRKLRLEVANLKLQDIPGPPPIVGPFPNCRISRESCREVQKALNERLHTNLDIDGKVGPLTKAAFREFQRMTGSTEADSLSDTDTKQLFAP